MNNTTRSEEPRRTETDREDIMREATALHRRASFRMEGFADPVIVGFKRTGAMSIYFDQDPVYQFDTEGRLRRAYRAGLLYRTQGTTLAELGRERSADQTTLLRHDLTGSEVAEFLTEMDQHLTKLASVAALPNQLEVVPAEADLTPEIRASLLQIQKQPTRLAPAIPTRR